MAETKKEEDSCSIPDTVSSHPSINEDKEEKPKYVPLETGDSKKAIPLILQRRTTLTRDQINKSVAAAATDGSEAKAEEHNTLLDCTLCKNVMLDPRECNKCRKGFCKQCINDYID